jgi:predicted phosphodiesterase
MKILHLSDLHLNRAWLEWAGQQAPHYDLVCVSGDLLDMFSRQAPLYGMVVIKKWADEFPGRLALCSGNHDGNDPAMTPPAHLLPRLGVKDRRHAEKLMLQERWMDALARAEVITDGRSELLPISENRVVVTTIPYDFTAVLWHEDLWRAGARLRRESGAPWIVLHHEPPTDTKVGGPFGNSGLPYLVEKYQPNFLLSGHIHLQPYCGDFAERLGGTWCFNPGAPDEIGTTAAAEPNHIVIDTVESTATWHFTNAAGVARQKRIINLRR